MKIALPDIGVGLSKPRDDTVASPHYPPRWAHQSPPNTTSHEVSSKRETIIICDLYIGLSICDMYYINTINTRRCITKNCDKTYHQYSMSAINQHIHIRIMRSQTIFKSIHRLIIMIITMKQFYLWTTSR